MNCDHGHHDNLPCGPMTSPFPFFLFLAFKKRKSTFKFNGNVNCKSYKELTFSVKLNTKSNNSGFASHVGFAMEQTDRPVYTLALT